jgi:hypothetical protein
MPLPRFRSRTALAVLGIVALSACGEVPTAVHEAADPEVTARQAPPPPGSGVTQPAAYGAPLLERLFQQALQKAASERGREAAAALAAPVRQLQEEATRARAAGDVEAFRRKVEEAEQAMAGVVVRVLGREPVQRLLTMVGTQLREVERWLQEAEAQGRDVAGPREAARQAAALYRSAGAAVSAGDPASALVAGSRAAAVLDRLLALRQAPQAPAAGVLQGLLDQALQRVAREQGREAAQRLSAELAESRERVDRARRAGDETAFRAALEAHETRMAGIVVRVLGPETAGRVLAHGAEQLARMQERLRRAESEGHDVARQRQTLGAAAELHGRALAALAAGDPVQALRLAAQALQLLS